MPAFASRRTIQELPAGVTVGMPMAPPKSPAIGIRRRAVEDREDRRFSAPALSARSLQCTT